MSLYKRGKNAIVAAVRAEARTLRLRGTGRLVKRVYPPNQWESDYVHSVESYGDSIMQIDTRSFIEWSVYVYGGYDIGSVALLRRLVHPGAVVFDVGANVGVFTLPFARAAGISGEVHAFEPHPDLRRRLMTNIALNNLRNVVVCDVALGATRGQAELYGSTTYNKGGSSLRASTQSDTVLQCTVETVDHYVALCGFDRLDLLKIDVEGADLSVLAGAQKTLDVYKPSIYVEVNPGQMQQFDASSVNMFTFLKEMGYEIWRNEAPEDDRYWRLAPVSRETAEVNRKFENWLAVHPHSVRVGNVLNP
jgi:FkbM family methyltransferase